MLRDSENRRKPAHWVVAAVFIVVVILECVVRFRPIPALQGNGVLDAALILGATSATLLFLSRQLPGQNVFLAAIIVAAIGGMASAIGTLTSVPFGPFTYTPDCGWQIFSILPWPVPLIWIVLVLNSRGAARLVLRPWRKAPRYGIWLLYVTTALALLLDCGLETFASRVNRFWLWSPTRLKVVWYGVTLVHLPGLALVVLLILLFVTPALLNKKPVAFPPDYAALAIWLLLECLFGIAAASRGFWPPAVLAAIGGLATLVLALRGAKSR